MKEIVLNSQSNYIDINGISLFSDNIHFKPKSLNELPRKKKKVIKKLHNKTKLDYGIKLESLIKKLK